jgi:phage terminase large subunit-like protein
MAADFGDVQREVALHDGESHAAAPRGLSLMERLVRLPQAAREGVLQSIPEALRLELVSDWRWQARPAQVAPDGDWAVWLILAGRGFGKTRAGAEWATEKALAQPGCRIALVGATAHDAISVMLEGESGLLGVAPAGFAPVHKATRRELHWPNGSIGCLFSAVEPDSLRGPQFHYAWCDEIAAWPKPKAAWDMLRLGMRLGERPQLVVTTTPRPMPLLKRLLVDADVRVSRGSTYDNRANLPSAFLGDLHRSYGATAMGRQEVMGELLENREGALWSRDGLEACRDANPGPFRRVVIGVDPPAGPGGCGIVVVALDENGIAYVLADASVSAVTPSEWTAAVVSAWKRHDADRIVAEINNGGLMVEQCLQANGYRLPMKTVSASRGKSARAEPVSVLYHGGLVKHLGAFPELEDEMCGLMAGGGYVGPGRSPDRADALVWALTELMLGEAKARPGLRALV